MSKKQLIIDKAIKLFAEKGIEATSIQQITEQCGISKGAFYLSFKSKDELITSIIDYFMQQVTADFDRVVRDGQDPQQKLYHFYLMSFQLSEKYANFAIVFIKEQLHSINDTLINQLNFYDKLTNQVILQLLDELYGEEIKETKYDLLVTIKAFMHTYSHMFFTSSTTYDLDLLSRILVEKTNLLAKHSKLAFLTEDKLSMIQHPASLNSSLPQIMTEIEKLINYVDDPIEHESLIILKEQFQSEKRSKAIISGLLHNLKKNEKCKWLIYLVKHYSSN